MSPTPNPSFLFNFANVSIQTCKLECLNTFDFRTQFHLTTKAHALSFLA